MILRGFSRKSLLGEIPSFSARILTNKLALYLKKKDGSESYTYEEMARAVYRFAENLLSSGIKPGDKIALISENRPRWVISYFSIVYYGMIAVPVDVNLTSGEMHNILEHADINGIFVSKKFARDISSIVNLKKLKFKLDLDDDAAWTSIEQVHKSEENINLINKNSKSIASLIYTSGTTGKPKGVLLSHANIINNIFDLDSKGRINRDSCLLSLLPLNHIFEFTAGLIGPLLTGATIYFCESLKPNKIVDALKQYKITSFNAVPILLSLIYERIDEKIEALPSMQKKIIRGLQKISYLSQRYLGLNAGPIFFQKVHAEFGGHLQQIICGGSFTNPQLVKNFSSLGFTIAVGYGLTETSPVISFNSNRRLGREDTVGVVAKSLKIKIMHPDATGAGEIWVKGKSVFPGYYKNEAAGLEVFKDGWFKTGDVGLLKKGHLKIVGRQKDMLVTSAGKNIYLDDVQNLYGKIQGILEYSLIGIPNDFNDPSQGEYIMAVVVPDADYLKEKKIHGDSIKSYFEEQFRELSQNIVMMKRVKQVFIFEEELPKTTKRSIKKFVLRNRILKLLQK
ncbi:AMP-binding protein [Candidatus Riflebacteria bacterium]